MPIPPFFLYGVLILHFAIFFLYSQQYFLYKEISHICHKRALMPFQTFYVDILQAKVCITLDNVKKIHLDLFIVHKKDCCYLKNIVII
jgi:hypothetical protein